MHGRRVRGRLHRPQAADQLAGSLPASACPRPTVGRDLPRGKACRLTRKPPAIANDAAADNTDVYAFVSPDKPDTVTLIANFVPLQNPAGGPNFYEFGDDVLYEIHIDNNGDGKPDVTYQFRFTTQVGNPNTFLYNTGPITTIADSPNWNRKQFYSVTKGRRRGGRPLTLGPNLACPPCNIGPASTPNYAAPGRRPRSTPSAPARSCSPASAPRASTSTSARSSTSASCGRSSQAHLVKMPKAPGINAHQGRQHRHHRDPGAEDRPHRPATADGTTTTNATTSSASTPRPAARRAVRYNADGTKTHAGAVRAGLPAGQPAVQRGAQPDPAEGQVELQRARSTTRQFAGNVTKPRARRAAARALPGRLPEPGGKYTKTAHRPAGASCSPASRRASSPASRQLPGRPAASPARCAADMLRLNMAVPPTTTKPSNLGLLGGDVAGFPNGRRVFDDVTTIELRAIAGAIAAAGRPDLQVRRRGRRDHRGPDVEQHRRHAPRTPCTTCRRSRTSARRTAGTATRRTTTPPPTSAPSTGRRRAGTIPVGAPETGVGPAPDGRHEHRAAGRQRARARRRARRRPGPPRARACCRRRRPAAEPVPARRAPPRARGRPRGSGSVE